MSRKRYKTARVQANEISPAAPVVLGINSAQKYFPFIVTVIFFILSFVGVLHHHPWRDEFQAWMIARDAHSLSGLHRNLLYDGHPMLFHFFLYIITAFSHNPFWMQLFCICISTAYIFLINRYAPFPLLINILITFGYYAFFEYNLIARSYGLGLLFVIMFCCLYKNRYKYYYLIVLSLFLLANTQSYGLLLAMCLSAILFLDFLLNWKSPPVSKIPLAVKIACAVVIMAGGILSAVQIAPAPDNTFPVNYPGRELDMNRVNVVMCQIFNAYYALPDFTDPHYWNTNFFGTRVATVGEAFYQVNLLLPALTFLIFSLYFIRKPLVLLLYAFGTLVLLCFYYYTLLIWQRYTGHLFILLLACMWISHYYNDVKYNNAIMKWVSAAGKISGHYLFIAVLCVGFLGGIVCYYNDLTEPFSTSYQAADFLKENKLDKLEIAGFNDFCTSPIAALLDRKMYYPNSKREGSFVQYDKYRAFAYKKGEMNDYFRDRISNGAKKIIMIYNFEVTVKDPETGAKKPVVDQPLTSGLHIKLLKAIPAGVVPDERFYIYQIEPEE